MTVKLPRIQFFINDIWGTGSQGELSSLSLGFGIHQAWIYSAMFGTSVLFNNHAILPVGARSFETASITDFYIVAIVCFAACLLFIGATDQKFLPFYTSKKVLRNASILTSLGTFLALASSIQPLIELLGGVIAGVASALLLVFWGTAFARESSTSIVINSIAAIATALSLYAMLIYLIPAPASAVITALLPLAELPLLQSKTPESYILRHEVPIFKPLPVKKGPFSVRFAIPILLAGFALGSLRSIATQVVIPSDLLSLNALIMIAAVALSACMLIALLFLGAHRYWDSLFKFLIPFTMLAVCFIPSSIESNSILASLLLIVGLVCLEALMWIFFGQLCQTFRLSSAFVFGVGRGCLALASLAGTLSVANTDLMDSLTPFGATSGILLYLGALVLAYVILPRVADIKRMIDPAFEGRRSPIDILNDEAEELRHIVSDGNEKAGPQSQGPSIDAAEPLDPTLQEPQEEDSSVWQEEPRLQKSTGAEQTEASTECKRSQAGGNVLPSRKGDPAPLKPTHFRRQCEAIANRYLLSRRETEVLFLLAKGHNAAFIHRKLHIAQSTTKTHIRHIYRKLDIHTQQELLEMISEPFDKNHPQCN